MYDHQKVHVYTAPSATGNGEATGIEARHAVGLVPLILRRVSVILEQEAATGTSAVITIQRRPIAGVAANQVTIDTITVPAAAAGQIYYVDGLDTKINPGEDVVADVTTAMGTQLTAGFVFEFDPSWDMPGNFTNMHESA
jgi:hypothetical protein